MKTKLLHFIRDIIVMAGCVSILLMVGCVSTATTTAGSSTTSTTASVFTQFGVEAAGTGATIAIVELVNKKDTHGTAQDILTIDAALLTLLNGTVPTEDQINSVMTSFKSDSSTTNYADIGQKIAAQFSTQIAAWEKSGATPQHITQYATWFIYGSQLGASIY